MTVGRTYARRWWVIAGDELNGAVRIQNAVAFRQAGEGGYGNYLESSVSIK